MREHPELFLLKICESTQVMCVYLIFKGGLYLHLDSSKCNIVHQDAI